MKKTIWKFGLISGAVISLLMVATIPFEDTDLGLVVGYTTIVLAFLFIYFGVRSYRDTVGKGSISFGRGFTIGTLIAVISSGCYVATWEVIYYKVSPDFTAKYAAHELNKAKANGASPEALAKREAELKRFAEMYKNPAYNVAMTFIEPFPVGLVIALVSAGVLRRRSRLQSLDVPQTSTA